MIGSMCVAVAGEIARQNAIAECEQRAMDSKIARGVPRAQAHSEMLAERDGRHRREREAADEIRKLTEMRGQTGIDPLYLAAAFAFGMAIG